MGRPSTLPTIAQATPELALDWHPDNTKTPDQVSIGAGLAARWKCRTLVTLDGVVRPCGWQWTAVVANRARSGHGCPACKGKVASDWNNVAAVHPHLVADWDPANDRAPEDVAAGSAYKANWTCNVCAHSWTKSVEKRTNGGYGCPHCAGIGVSDTHNVAALRPDLAVDWHPDNPTRPEEHRPGSPHRVQWLCHNTVTVNGNDRECGHAWTQGIAIRASGHGCPACAGKAIADWNSVAVTHPHLLNEWSPRNERGPETYRYASHARIWWTCHNRLPRSVNGREVCGYEYESALYNRTSGKGCPACAGQHLTEWNTFAALRPDLLHEWAPENALSPHEISVGTDYRATWVCSTTATLDGKTIACGHRWQTRPSNRALLDTGCPACSTNATSKAEIYLAHEIAIFHDVVNSTTRVPGAERDWLVDIVIHDSKIAVEYDGAKWHRGSVDRDLRKTGDLQAGGWTVIRARERPLDLLGSLDVHCHAGTPKATANAVLTRIQEVLGTPTAGLADYLTEPDTRARQDADLAIAALRARDLRRRARRRVTGQAAS